MNIKPTFYVILALIVFLIMGTMPIWWDAKASYLFGFPAYLTNEIDAYIEAVKWLIDRIFC